MPSSGSSTASSRRWWRPRRSSSASTSARSTWSARSARRARSRASCSASGAPAMPSTARPRAGCFRSRATSWWSARRSSTASAAASSTGSRSPSSRSTCWRSRSWPRWRRANGARTSSMPCVRRAWPYRELPREDFAAVVGMLAEGFSTRRGRRGALIHYDAVNHVLRSRRGARLTALTAGGTIPDNADYQVLLEPENHVIGTVNEDFAVESMGGDIFQLGNKSYRIIRVERGVVRVEDAHGQPPTIPFWLGEAPGRSDELSVAVSRLRDRDCRALAEGSDGRACLALAGGRGRHRRARRPAAGRVSGAAHAALDLPADAGHHRARALLRRGRRHAARGAFALRQPHQPRLGPGAAQALLPQVQFRAAGGGDRGQYRALAHDRAQLRARRGRALPALRHRPAGADPGACWTRRCSSRAGAG